MGAKTRTSLCDVTSPHTKLSANPHDRTGVRRKDEAWLEERWADPDARVLLISGTRVRLVEGRIAWVSPAEAPEGFRVLLGEHDGRTWFHRMIFPCASGAHSRFSSSTVIVDAHVFFGFTTIARPSYATGSSM